MDLARKVREKILPNEVIKRVRASSLAERIMLLDECISQNISLISIGRSVDKAPSSLKDKNWRGRALEVYLGGKNNAEADRDFIDGELKSTRVLNKDGKWVIEQTLRITTLEHADLAHLNEYHTTPFYRKISCFTCALFNSVKGDIQSGHIVDYFTFRIEDDSTFDALIKEDYLFYKNKIKSTHRLSSKIKSPNGFLGCRQTAGEAGADSKTSLYITKEKFNFLLDFYNINK